MYKIKRKIGESFTINSTIEIKVLEHDGENIEIGICVPESSKILPADSPDIIETINSLVNEQSTTIH
ncbi:MAG: carbon storage regulator [Gammaproteobacteria bacterium]|nr:carbon storage regulator [Gammaproteobacteria bacterium]